MENPGAGFYQQCCLYDDRDDVNHARGTGTDWRFQTCLELCRSGPDRKLLDIGCGDGEFLALAQAKGFEVFGIDFDDRAVQKARRVRQLEHVSTASSDSLKGIEGWREFGIITLFDVLEHLSSPRHVIATVFELLKPGGMVCITVPRFDRYPRVFDSEADFPPHHLTLWTSRALSVLLQTTGFRDLRVIEKPLVLEDLWKQFKWPALRVARKLGARVADPCNGRSKPSSAKPSTAGFIKKSMRTSLGPANWVLKACSLGRGHTLLALGTKPHSAA
ncbi:MAG TPA: class I SAM-dependent methyltransferase [Terriglobia bacterium]